MTGAQLARTPGRSRVPACRRCGASPLPVHGPGRHDGRGLCSSCRPVISQAGGLHQYPRTTRTRSEVLTAARDLRAVRPHSIAELARELGMTYGAVEIALRRARADGELV
jgi:hypothetical protein